MKRLLPLPDEDEFYFDLHYLNSINQLGEFIENPKDFPYGYFLENDFKDEGTDFFKVGTMFVFTNALHPIPISGLAVEASMAYAKLINDFTAFETQEAKTLQARESIIHGTKFIVAQLLDVEEDNKKELSY